MPFPDYDDEIEASYAHAEKVKSETQLTLQNEIREAVRDGLANHSGEFANPWIFKGSYSHELLADILNDIMASERLFKNLEALFQQALTSLKGEMGKLKQDEMQGAGASKDPDIMYALGYENGANNAISECQRVIDDWGK